MSPFRKRVFMDVIKVLSMWSSWIWVGLVLMAGVLARDRWGKRKPQEDRTQSPGGMEPLKPEKSGAQTP